MLNFVGRLCLTLAQGTCLDASSFVYLIMEWPSYLVKDAESSRSVLFYHNSCLWVLVSLLFFSKASLWPTHNGYFSEQITHMNTCLFSSLNTFCSYWYILLVSHSLNYSIGSTGNPISFYILLSFGNVCSLNCIRVKITTEDDSVGVEGGYA